MSACRVTDEGLLIGTGDVVAGATTITSWSQDGGWIQGTVRKNVQVSVGSKTYSTRIMADGGTTLTMKDGCPFTDAA